jgi:UDP-glucose 4-epimerase
MDLAEAHVKALNRLLEFKNIHKHEVFNIGSQKGYSVMEVIHAFEKCNKLKLKVGEQAILLFWLHQQVELKMF